MKKIFKKMTAVSTALALTLGMSFTAFAADPATPTPDTGRIDQFDDRDEVAGEIPSGSNKYINFETTKSSTGNVIVRTANKDETKVYRIDVNWEELVFTYTFADDSTWDPDTHTYGTTNDGSWDKSSAKITVTNHSNDTIDVSSKFDNNDTTKTTKDVTSEITDSTGTIDTAEGTALNSAPKHVITVGVSGKPNDTRTFSVGIVTVTLSTN